MELHYGQLTNIAMIKITTLDAIGMEEHVVSITTHYGMSIAKNANVLTPMLRVNS